MVLENQMWPLKSPLKNGCSYLYERCPSVEGTGYYRAGRLLIIVSVFTLKMEVLMVFKMILLDYQMIQKQDGLTGG